MTINHKISIVGVLLAKFFGMIGILLGFFGGEIRHFGGWLLAAAGASLFTSIVSSLSQSQKDRINFDLEDRNISENIKLREVRAGLIREIEVLKRQRSDLVKAKINNRIF